MSIGGTDQGYVNNLDTTNLSNIPLGATNAVYVGPIALQNLVRIKVGPTNGASQILLIGATTGTTMSAGVLASLYAGNAFYSLGLSETLSIDGPARFYVAAIGGQSAQVSLFKGLNA